MWWKISDQNAIRMANSWKSGEYLWSLLYGACMKWVMPLFVWWIILIKLKSNFPFSCCLSNTCSYMRSTLVRAFSSFACCRLHVCVCVCVSCDKWQNISFLRENVENSMWTPNAFESNFWSNDNFWSKWNVLEIKWIARIKSNLTMILHATMALYRINWNCLSRYDFAIMRAEFRFYIVWIHICFKDIRNLYSGWMCTFLRCKCCETV